MCVRGLLMLLLNEKFADFLGQGVSEKVLSCIVSILEEDLCEESRE